MHLCPVVIALASVELLYKHLTFPSESIRNGKNININNSPPYIRPWHSGVSVPPHQWDRSEQNCSNVLHKKQHHSFPPSLSSTLFIPPVPPAWNNISYQLPFACQLDALTPNIASKSVAKPVVLSDIANTCLQSPVKKKIKASLPAPKSEVKPKSKNPPLHDYCMFSYTFQKFLSKGWMNFHCTYHRNPDCNSVLRRSRSRHACNWL